MAAIGAVVLAAAGDDASVVLLPDLTMSPPADLRTERSDDGGHVLRFSAVMNNEGAGDLVVDGERDGAAWRLTQHIDREGDTPGVQELAADLVWGGDGHDHWHVLGAARYRLEDRAGVVGDPDRVDHKVGFCIFDSVPHDTDLPGAPAAVVYPSEGCGEQGDDTVAMGLSVGWGDRYQSWLPGQWIDITGLPPGTYRVVASVDPDGLFTESDTTNNEAWTEFVLEDDGDGPTIEVIASGV